ncbi:INO80 complex subunit C-like [Sycon ciliatum]|uniref:INO80 complex subunit C-like n=1 Tax=Sycon ciliatum TaxID=27933 RepID=UPI0031F6D940|eukprot:scpid54800/ scgid21997/ INO80 complex subunit C
MAGAKRRGKRPAVHAEESPSAKRTKHVQPACRTSSRHSSGSPVESADNEDFSPATTPRGRGGANRGRGRSGKILPAAKAPQPFIAHPFKNPLHKSSGKVGSKKPVWKSLKQIVAAERALPWRADDPTYSSIDAPPSLKPVKKYADISGLDTNYTDPSTKLRYASANEFQMMRALPPDIVQGYLALRGAQQVT